jgi:hypothetical protein
LCSLLAFLTCIYLLLRKFSVESIRTPDNMSIRRTHGCMTYDTLYIVERMWRGGEVGLGYGLTLKGTVVVGAGHIRIAGHRLMVFNSENEGDQWTINLQERRICWVLLSQDETATLTLLSLILVQSIGSRPFPWIKQHGAPLNTFRSINYNSDT